MLIIVFSAGFSLGYLVENHTMSSFPPETPKEECDSLQSTLGGLNSSDTVLECVKLARNVQLLKIAIK